MTWRGRQNAIALTAHQAAVGEAVTEIVHGIKTEDPYRWLEDRGRIGNFRNRSIGLSVAKGRVD